MRYSGISAHIYENKNRHQRQTIVEYIFVDMPAISVVLPCYPSTVIFEELIQALKRQFDIADIASSHEVTE